MSGYRTLHRENPSKNNGENVKNVERIAIWSVKFSPCIQSRVKEKMGIPSQCPPLPLRFLTCSSDGLVRAYTIEDKRGQNKDDGKALDATACKMKLTDVLLPCSSMTYPIPQTERNLAIGSACLDIVRNHVGDDTNAGDEVVTSMRLDGLVSVHVRHQQPLYTTDTDGNNNGDHQDPNVVMPLHEFAVPNATGSSLKLLPPQSTGHDTRNGILLLAGCLDGSIQFYTTGVPIQAANANANANQNETTDVPPPGTHVCTIAGGTSSIPTSIALHPLHSRSISVGRKDGTVDLFSSSTSTTGANVRDYRRVHRFAHHANSTVRGLTYTPDGTLLVSGCDAGNLYVHDTSSLGTVGDASVRMVGAVVATGSMASHRGYILSLEALEDSRRFMSCGADGTVKVWNVAEMGGGGGGVVHTFDTGHVGMVWNVAASTAVPVAAGAPAMGTRRAVSCGEDGLLQIYSYEDS